jgi:serine O-acetyltransferase
VSTDPRRQQLIARLSEARQRHCYPFNVRTEAREFLHLALGLLFPHFSEVPDCSSQAVASDVDAAERQLSRLVSSLTARAPGGGPSGGSGRTPNDVVGAFMGGLPRLQDVLREDAEAIYAGDPAAKSVDEVLLTYPGFFAIAVFRLAHELWQLGVPLLPRLLTESAHQQTGVDIHPGASIGRRFFIDHGTGVVIGETCVIGNGVKLYQGVTLGALVVEKELGDSKRHPTLEDNVVVYAHATILGGRTVIGHDTVVGGNAWLTHSVPPFSVVSHESEVRPRRRSSSATADGLDFHI